MNTKICPRCKNIKILQDFHVNRATKTGRQVYCKTCKIEIQHEKAKEINAYHRKYRSTKKYKIWYLGWLAKNRENILRRGVSRRIKIRAEAILNYGETCACCGESTAVFLAIDHINGGGSKLRRDSGMSSSGFYMWLKKHNWPEGFQILCHNCNWAKHALGKCPHQKWGNDTIVTVEKKL